MKCLALAILASTLITGYANACCGMSTPSMPSTPSPPQHTHTYTPPSYTPPSIGVPGAGAASSAARDAVDSGRTNIRIRDQMAADAAKQQRDRWQNLYDTQTKLFEIGQDVTVNKARNADRAWQAFDNFTRW